MSEFPEISTMAESLVVVSNRLPFVLKRNDDGTLTRKFRYLKKKIIITTHAKGWHPIRFFVIYSACMCCHLNQSCSLNKFLYVVLNVSLFQCWWTGDCCCSCCGQMWRTVGGMARDIFWRCRRPDPWIRGWQYSHRRTLIESGKQSSLHPAPLEIYWALNLAQIQTQQNSQDPW